MIKLFFTFSCIGIYIGIMLTVYAVLNKIDPYDEVADTWGDGDGNKYAAAFWPISVPVLIFCYITEWFGSIMDLIREYQKDGGKMAKYKVYYSGWYIIEADTIDEAIETDRDDCIYEEWENTDAVLMED